MAVFNVAANLFEPVRVALFRNFEDRISYAVVPVVTVKVVGGGGCGKNCAHEDFVLFVVLGCFMRNFLCGT